MSSYLRVEVSKFKVLFGIIMDEQVTMTCAAGRWFGPGFV